MVRGCAATPREGVLATGLVREAPDRLAWWLRHPGLACLYVRHGRHDAVCCSMKRKTRGSETNLPAEHSQASQEPWVPSPHVDAGRACDRAGPPPAGPPAPVGLTARRAVRRIGDRATFEALRATRARARSGPLAATFVPGASGAPPRVAYAIRKHVGAAVDRNRLRRRLRAAVHDGADRLESGAYLVSVGPEARHLSFEELRSTVQWVMAQAVDKSR